MSMVRRSNVALVLCLAVSAAGCGASEGAGTSTVASTTTTEVVSPYLRPEDLKNAWPTIAELQELISPELAANLRVTKASAVFSGNPKGFPWSSDIVGGVRQTYRARDTISGVNYVFEIVIMMGADKDAAIRFCTGFVSEERTRRKNINTGYFIEDLETFANFVDLDMGCGKNPDRKARWVCEVAYVKDNFVVWGGATDEDRDGLISIIPQMTAEFVLNRVIDPDVQWH